MLGRCTVLIEEACPLRRQFMLSEAERALLPADCATILVPTLAHELALAADDRGFAQRGGPGAPYGAHPASLCRQTGVRCAKKYAIRPLRMAAYLATDVLAAAGVAEAHELWMSDSFAREHGCDIKVAAYMLHHFRELRLFYTHGHPTGRMMAYVLAQLIGHPAMRRGVHGTTRCAGADGARLGPAQRRVRGRGGADPSRGRRAFRPRVDHFRMVFRWLHRDWSFEEWLEFLLTYEPEVAKAAE